ncbi:acyltransferase, partial [Bacillus mycoides]|nr:acyltransferase [Bacillus mycoides]
TISISAMVIGSIQPFHTWVTGPSPTTNKRWAKIAFRKNHEKVFKPYL